MPIVHAFDWPDRVVVGTIGEPGARAFYLQARTGSRVISVALEKEQSAVLAETIEEILDELGDDEGNPFHVPTETPVELIDTDPLDQPVEPEFRTGSISLGWDPTTAQLVIEAYPVQDDNDDPLDPDEVEPSEMLVIRIPVGTARAFAKRTLDIVGGGRPLCPRCGLPMNLDGHVCSTEI